MEIQRCPRGHFFDADQNSTCPTCESGGGEIDMNPGVDNIGATEPAGDFFFPGNGGGTESVDRPPFGGFDNSAAFGGTIAPNPAPAPAPAPSSEDSYGATIPLGGFGPATTTAPAQPTPVNNGYTATTPITPFTPPTEPAVSTPSAANDGYGPTTFISPNPQKQQNPARPAGAPPVSQKLGLPVVGWLVCIEGNNKGADYRIHGQYNYIGRGAHMDICITGDNYISSERAAVIAYDDLNKAFFFAPGMGTNIVRVNDMMVMSHVQLKPYDRIQIGMTKLLFVPFCGERFDWNA